MATNPLYQSNDSPNNATQPTKSVNRQGVYVPRTHNTFDNSYYNFKTQKFGQYEPFFVMEGVPGDVIPLHSAHTVRSLPMSSPFLSDLKLNKDYFMVPMNAILPNTWDYIFKNPAQGDDVPFFANCIVDIFGSIEGGSFIDNMFSYCMDGESSLASKFFMLLNLEMFLSQGSLLAQVGYHLNPTICEGNDELSWSFDEWFDGVCRSITHLQITFNDTVYDYYSTPVSDPNVNSISLYQALSILRSYGSRVAINSLEYNDTDFTHQAYITGLPFFPEFGDEHGPTVNLKRLYAYQMACSQFYVNPQVDFLYNAQLYRDNLWTLYKILMPDMDMKFFSMNGIQIPYDYTSGIYFHEVIARARQINFAGMDPAKLFDLLSAIFGHRESLRFGDYFTDSRTRPLALGSDSIDVSSDNKVSVIDVSKRIVYQRFRNAVVKLGNNAGDYLRGIFGTSPSPDYHFPKFIAHQDFSVNGFEVSNQTSEGQGNLVTNLNTRDDTFAFEVDVDMPCVLIGISYLSVPRVYMQTKDRHFFHQDRYDEFNPMLQYVGDQVVYNHERTDTSPNNLIFGYQSRNNEYKQRYGVVSGGFATKLPAWTFVADSIFNPSDFVILFDTQSPDFIRAHDYEFNRFFNSISGYSLANSFHFIMVYNNKCMSTRPMEINPNIL